MVTTEADIVLAESMIASSWPALNFALSGRWLLGMANGVSGRANSLFFLDPSDDKNYSARLDWMEQTYRRVGLPPRVRVSPLAPTPVIKELQNRGYIFQKPTITLRRTLADEVFENKTRQDIKTCEKYDDEWLQTFIDCSPHYADKQHIICQMLDSILDDTLFFCTRSASTPVATAMAVIHLNVMTIQNVATIKSHQRQGFGRAIMEKAMHEGREREVTWCWIAVDQTNKPALSLYANLGFKDFYRYIYASLEA